MSFSRSNSLVCLWAAIACFQIALNAPGQEPAQPPAIDVEQVATLLEFVLEADEATARECLGNIIQQAKSGELKQEQLAAFKSRLSKTLGPVWNRSPSTELGDSALQLAILWDEAGALAKARTILDDPQESAVRRALMLGALGSSGDPKWIADLTRYLSDQAADRVLRATALESLAKYDSEQVADAIVAAHATLPTDLQGQAITQLTQRASWSRRLVKGVQDGKIPSAAVGLSHLRSLFASRDAELTQMVKKQWGAVRTERNPAREQILAKMRTLLSSKAGDAVRGQAVFQKVCGQCHKIYGSGQEVGPDITSNGRSSFDQLLSNVFDPSLVIGPAYQAVTVITVDGRVLTGLLAEDSDQRVVLKTQGGKLETIPRSDVEELAASKLSLMPENLEEQLKPEELIDLFAFLTLDKPPQDPAAKLISGTPVSGQ